MAETIKNQGIKPLSVDTALDVLQSLLSTHKMSQIAVLSLDRETIGQQFQLLPASPYLQSLIASETETVTTVKPEQHNTVFQTLLGLEVKQQTAFLTDYLQTLLARIKQVAKTEINADKSLLDLGMDSLMVMEALNQVKQDLSLMIYPREIYQHPVIAQLSAYLAREFQKNHQEKSHKSAVGAQELLPSRSQGLAVLDSQSTLLFSVASDLSINIEKKLPPIAFILSSPRSGSTLLRVMLAGHPQLVSPPELHLLPFNTMKEREESLSLSYLGEGLTRALMELEKKEQIEAEKEIQQWIDQNTPIAEVYLKLIELANHRLLIDKSPTYGMSLDILRRAESIFDGAKYIHLIRHPYAVIDSFCRLRMNKLVGLENDNPYEVAESIWTNSNQNILDLSQEIDGNRYLPVLYENLVKNPEPVMREICTFLGLEFNEAVLNPYQEDTNKSRMTDGVYGVSLSVGDPNFQKRNTIDAKLAEVSNKIKLPHILSKKTQQLAEKFNYSLPINPDYPLIETMIQGRDLNLCLCSWGPETGEIVLCVHGILDSGAMWEPVALELAKTGYRVIAPDLAGHGRSEHRNIYHFVDFIADLAAICHQLTNKPLILVGHSLGGVIGASYASIRPERVKKLVLVEPVLPNTEIDDTVSQLSQLIDYLAVRPQHPLLPTVTAAAERLRIGIPEIGETLAMKLAQRVTESVDGGVRWRWDPLLRTRAGIGFNGMSQAAYLSLLGKISAPTTLVYGDKSGFNRPEDLHKQQEAIKGGKWLVLSGGHHLHLENSTEIARLIIDN
jgi:pimeloyl-ACP methyl ester carboxylesterase/acyl carrier protein